MLPAGSHPVVTSAIPLFPDSFSPVLLQCLGSVTNDPKKMEMVIGKCFGMFDKDKSGHIDAAEARACAERVLKLAGVSCLVLHHARLGCGSVRVSNCSPSPDYRQAFRTSSNRTPAAELMLCCATQASHARCAGQQLGTLLHLCSDAMRVHMIYCCTEHVPSLLFLQVTNVPASQVDSIFNKVAGTDQKLDKAEFTLLVNQLLSKAGAATAPVTAAPATPAVAAPAAAPIAAH